MELFYDNHRIQDSRQTERLFRSNYTCLQRLHTFYACPTWTVVHCNSGWPKISPVIVWYSCGLALDLSSRQPTTECVWPNVDGVKKTI